MMRRLLTAVILLAAAPAGAADFDWSADPVGAFQVARTDAPVPQFPLAFEIGRSRQEADPAYDADWRVYAKPMGASTLPQRRGFGTYQQARLVLNNDKDRVGAELDSCERANSSEDYDDCDTLRFSFPQLKADKDNKRILWNDEVVASWGFFGMKIHKGFRLRHVKLEQLVDDGFNRRKVDSFIVMFERSGE